MIHIAKHVYETDDGGRAWPKTVATCGALLGEEDRLVEVAMQSDCDDCRATVMVGTVKALGVSEPQRYEPEPHPDADAIMEAKRRHVDGR